MADWSARTAQRAAPRCVRSAEVGLLSTAVGFAIVLLVGVQGAWPGWLQATVFAWMAVAVAWYAFWLGRRSGQGPGCAVEPGPVGDATPSASDDGRRQVPAP